ncbi:MAG: hypothetical protein AMXMBFR64_38880 [Myxococcales bacterium]
MTVRFAWILLLAGCLTDPGEPSAVAEAPNLGTVSAAGWPPPGGALAEGDAASPAPVAAVRVAAIDTMGFTREASPGVARGFDLDGKVSAKGDESTCGHGDLMSPDGLAGVDNQLALLVPLFDLVGIGAVEGLIQGAIEDGGLLLMIQLEGLDDITEDDSVTATLRVGQGKPLLGTDGLLLASQTFRPNPAYPDSPLPGAHVTGGVLHAGPFETRLPIVVFGVHYELTVRNAVLRARVTWDGGLEDGLLGGGVPIADLMAIATVADSADFGVLAAVEMLLNGAGDLVRGADGECAELSAALTFSAVGAFLQE